MLDDCSRYGVALEARNSETELDMLRVFIRVQIASCHAAFSISGRG
jgi:hypothetical protein